MCSVLVRFLLLFFSCCSVSFLLVLIISSVCLLVAFVLVGLARFHVID